MNVENKPRIVIAGGTGCIGSVLAPALAAQGYEIVILTRNPEKVSAPHSAAQWDGKNFGPWVGAIDGASAIINLAGESMNCRYTKRMRPRLLTSRINPVRALAEAVRRARQKPLVWIQASSLGIYGNAANSPCDEMAPAGPQYYAQLAAALEGEFLQTNIPGVRKMALRLGFVLGNSGGALPVLARLAKLWLGGTLGSGRQHVSWIHESDLVQVVRLALRDPQLHGIFNACSPGSVPNRLFMKALRAALEMPWGLPLPGLAVRLGALFRRTDSSLALHGRLGNPHRLLEAGFTFTHPNLEQALTDLLGRTAPQPTSMLCQTKY